MGRRRIPQRKPLLRPIGNTATVVEQLDPQRYVIDVGARRGGRTIGFYAGPITLPDGQRVTAEWREESRLWLIEPIRNPGGTECGGVFKGSFVADTGGGVQLVSDPGFTFAPAAVIMWANLATAADGMVAGSAGQSFGFTDGTTSRVRSFATADGAETFAGAHYDTLLRLLAPDGTVLAEADVTALGGGRITLAWTTTPAAAYVVHYLAIGGSAHVGDYANTPSGAHVEDGFGFAPGAVLFMSFFVSTAPPVAFTGAGEVQFGLGLAGGDPVVNRCAHSKFDAGIFNVAPAGVRPDGYRVFASGSTTNDGFNSGDLATLDDDGFTVTVDNAGGRVAYLALGGGQYAVGFDNAPATAGADSLTGLAFAPGGALFVTDSNPGSGDVVVDAHHAIGIFGADAGGRGGGTLDLRDADDSAYGQDAAAALAMADPNEAATPAIVDEATVAFTADGWDLDWTAASGNEPRYVYLAICAPGADFGPTEQVSGDDMLYAPGEPGDWE